ncbi:MAG TPA: hypothetical protein VEJ18_21665 [Planctomycetota bacterium]|nr:hypothetical protein [Planctomycetota bacterium]
MAKRKLSSEQRTELRQEMSKALAAGQKPADILNETAKKYGITTITARWYLKSLDGGKSAGRGRKRRGPGRPPGSGARRGRRPGRRAGGTAGDGLAGALASARAASVKQAKAAQKLFARWQGILAKQGSLRKIERTVKRQLARLSRQAKAVGRRISRLVER